MASTEFYGISCVCRALQTSPLFIFHSVHIFSRRACTRKWLYSHSSSQQPTFTYFINLIIQKLHINCHLLLNTVTDMCPLTCLHKGYICPNHVKFPLSLRLNNILLCV